MRSPIRYGGWFEYTLNKEREAITRGQEILGNTLFKEKIWREKYLEAMKRQEESYTQNDKRSGGITT
jgi:hypothetical protein